MINLIKNCRTMRWQREQRFFIALVGELSVKNQRIFALSEHIKMHQFWQTILIKFCVSFKGFSSVMCVPHSYNSRNE